MHINLKFFLTSKLHIKSLFKTQIFSNNDCQAKAHDQLFNGQIADNLFSKAKSITFHPIKPLFS